MGTAASELLLRACLATLCVKTASCVYARPSSPSASEVAIDDGDDSVESSAAPLGPGGDLVCESTELRNRLFCGMVGVQLADAVIEMVEERFLSAILSGATTDTTWLVLERLSS